jgi:hypothetical protein
VAEWIPDHPGAVAILLIGHAQPDVRFMDQVLTHVLRGLGRSEG